MTVEKEAGLAQQKYCKDCRFFEFAAWGNHKCSTRLKTIIDYVNGNKRKVKVLCSKRNAKGKCRYWRKKK